MGYPERPEKGGEERAATSGDLVHRLGNAKATEKLLQAARNRDRETHPLCFRMPGSRKRTAFPTAPDQVTGAAALRRRPDLMRALSLRLSCLMRGTERKSNTQPRVQCDETDASRAAAGGGAAWSSGDANYCELLGAAEEMRRRRRPGFDWRRARHIFSWRLPKYLSVCGRDFFFFNRRMV
jgi:hypothetical protein